MIFKVRTLLQTLMFYYCNYFSVKLRKTAGKSDVCNFWKKFAFEHLTAGITTWELVKCRSCRIVGRRVNAMVVYWFQKGVYYWEAIGQGGVVIVVVVQSKIARILPLSHHFHHHSDPVYPNPGTTDRANQYEFCFGCLLCVVIRIHQHCGNLPPTPMMNGRHATTTIPAQTEKNFINKICSFSLLEK